MPAAGHDLTGPERLDPGRGGQELPAPAAAVLEDWLDRLAATLPGPRRARAAIVEELRDGLYEATLARLVASAGAAGAAHAAVAEFGDPATVARGFVGELADARARTLTLTLVGSGPLVGAAWIGALAPAATSAGLVIPPWQAQAGRLWAAWPLIPAAVATIIAAAVLVIAATGPLGRWLPAHLRHRPRLAPTAAATAGVITAAVDLSLLVALAASALSAFGTGPIPDPLAGSSAVPLLPVAVAASLVRLTLATRAACGCLTLN